MADSASGGSWWGGWLQTAKEKSTSALDFMKKDLAEFTSVMQKDTTVAAGAVREKINHETASEATRKMKDGMSSILGGISKALVIEPEDKHYRGEPITADSHIFDRAKARLHAIQLDPATYCVEPSGPPEKLEAWLSGFELDEQKGAISELLVSNVQVRGLYTQLVPSEVSHANFWQRYFYKVHQLEQDEARKAALKRRADAGAQEAELEWDDDEWGDLEASSSQPTPPTSTSTSSPSEWTRVDAEPEKSAGTATDSRLPEVQSLSSTDSTKSDSVKTDWSSTDSKPETTPEEAVGSVENAKQDAHTTHGATGEQSAAAQCDRTLPQAAAGPAGQAQPQSVTPSGEDSAQRTTTLPSSENKTKEEAKESLSVPTRDKGDLVLVGSDRNTPSSDSSQSKEVSSLDDDWEKDFDIEVTEEDIKLAQEAARKLTDETTVGPGEEDDEWENWD